MKSSDPGASLSLRANPAVDGRNLYFAYHVWGTPSGEADKAAIAVDGTLLARVDEPAGSPV